VTEDRRSGSSPNSKHTDECTLSLPSLLRSSTRCEESVANAVLLRIVFSYRESQFRLPLHHFNNLHYDTMKIAKFLQIDIEVIAAGGEEALRLKPGVEIFWWYSK